VSEYEIFIGLTLFFAWLTWLAIKHWKAVLVIVVALFLSLLVVVSYGVAHALEGDELENRPPGSAGLSATRGPGA
jgi:hypothetical protein